MHENDVFYEKEEEKIDVPTDLCVEYLLGDVQIYLKKKP